MVVPHFRAEKTESQGTWLLCLRAYIQLPNGRTWIQVLSSQMPGWSFSALCCGGRPCQALHRTHLWSRIWYDLVWPSLSLVLGPLWDSLFPYKEGQESYPRTLPPLDLMVLKSNSYIPLPQAPCARPLQKHKMNLNFTFVHISPKLILFLRTALQNMVQHTILTLLGSCFHFNLSCRFVFI